MAEGGGPKRRAGLLRTILKFDVRGTDFRDRLYVWESLSRDYEKPQANGVSDLGDEIKIASVIEGSAGKLKEWLVSRASNPKNYRQLRITIDERYDGHKAYIAPAATHHSDHHYGRRANPKAKEKENARALVKVRSTKEKTEPSPRARSRTRAKAKPRPSRKIHFPDIAPIVASGATNKANVRLIPRVAKVGHQIRMFLQRTQMLMQQACSKRIGHGPTRPMKKTTGKIQKHTRKKTCQLVSHCCKMRAVLWQAQM
jgi:hypothetical protein